MTNTLGEFSVLTNMLVWSFLYKFLLGEEKHGFAFIAVTGKASGEYTFVIPFVIPMQQL